MTISVAKRVGGHKEYQADLKRVLCKSVITVMFSV